MVQFAPVIIVFIFFSYSHALCLYLWSLYFKTFSASYLITFKAPEISVSINRDVPSSLSLIMTSNLLLGKILSVCN